MPQLFKDFIIGHSVWCLKTLMISVKIGIVTEKQHDIIMNCKLININHNI